MSGKKTKRICGGQQTRKRQAIIAFTRKLLVVCWVLLRHQEKWNAAKAQPYVKPIPLQAPLDTLMDVGRSVSRDSFTNFWQLNNAKISKLGE